MPDRDRSYVVLVGRITGNEVDGYLVELLEDGAVIETVWAPGGRL